MEKQQSTKSTKCRKLKMLNSIENIVNLATENGLNDEFYAKANKGIKYLAKKMSLTPMQAIIFSLFVNRSDDQFIYLNEISRDIKCSTISILKFKHDIEVLIDRHLIKRRKNDERTSYRVPLQVIEALQNDECYQHKTMTNVSADELMVIALNNLFNERSNNEIPYSALVNEVCELLENNRHLNFASKTLSTFFSDETQEMILFVYFCHLWVNNDDDYVRYSDLEDLYENKLIFSHIKRTLYNGDHPLQKRNLIVFNNNDGLVDRESMRLSDYAKDNFLNEMCCSLSRINNNDHRLTNHTSIVAKNMFYNPSEQNQIDELTSLLSRERFDQICTRLADSGMRQGFACLFYGAPGTGKTETALQLARLTGRDIFQVNISEIKSCWVGESEKNIKKIFDSYRNMVNTSDVAPILLFNEADAIISKRTEDAQRAVDKMENSIQNIILQEMETLNGIMLATTNLTCNLDKAFERRFLYKIKFDKPCLEAKSQIWSSMIPEISADDAKTLASKYDFSGGQIENIARKRTVDNILNDKSTTDLQSLQRYCDNELIADPHRSNKVGF